MSAAKPHHNSLPRKKVLIVDDHPMTRRGLAQVINGEADLAVCGEADTAARALETVRPLAPDLVLADITMPGRSGLEFLKDMQVLHPEVPVLVLSMHDESVYGQRALRAGARGYLMKSEGADKVLEAIRLVLQGRTYVSGKMLEAMVGTMRGRRAGAPEPRPAALTDREFEIFHLLGHGLSTRAIAERLNLSEKTVGTHRVHIKEKLGAKTAAELVRQAVQWTEAQAPN